VPALRSRVAPLGSDGTNQNAVTRAENLHFATCLGHDTERLVAECQVLSRTDAARDRVRVGRTDQRSGGPHDRIVGTWVRHRLVHEPDLADVLHYECLHHPPRHPQPLPMYPQQGNATFYSTDESHANSVPTFLGDMLELRSRRKVATGASNRSSEG
jgi:hypothetical protein